jgi:uncharacterized protein YbjT (DUF2867 family)
MSQWTSHRNHPALMTRQTWLMDKMFAEFRGIAHTILNPGLFADDFLRVIDSAALLGFFPMLTGDGKVAPVANEDIARTAVAVLMAPERHDGMRKAASSVVRDGTVLSPWGTRSAPWRTARRARSPCQSPTSAGW